MRKINLNAQEGAALLGIPFCCSFPTECSLSAEFFFLRGGTSLKMIPAKKKVHKSVGVNIKSSYFKYFKLVPCIFNEIAAVSVGRQSTAAEAPERDSRFR